MQIIGVWREKEKEDPSSLTAWGSPFADSIVMFLIADALRYQPLYTKFTLLSVE